MGRPTLLAALAAWALSAEAAAAKLPATINVGIGPTVGTVGNPKGNLPLSAGLALQVEGWVSGKTLHSKKVMRRVPKSYRSLVRKMDDAHVVPLPVWVLPDRVWLGSLDSSTPTLTGASWSPLNLSLLHKAEGLHATFSVAPRVSWLRFSAPGQDPVHQAWLGGSLGPEIQTNLQKRVGVALGGCWGAGASKAQPSAGGHDLRPWMMADAYARLQLRFPIEVNL